MNNKQINIIMVGSHTHVKGGMTSVLKRFLENDHFNNKVNVNFVPTHIDANKIYQLIFFAVAIIKLSTLFINNKNKIVHMHLSERGSFYRKYIVFILAKVFKKKIITHCHGAEFETFYEQQGKFIKGKIKKLLHESSVVLALGKQWSSTLKKIEPDANIIVLRNAVKIPTLAKELKKQEMKEINILFLAVLIQRKGILDLIESSKDVVKFYSKKDIHVNFHIAGSGDLYDESISMVNKNGLNNNFVFHGWINEESKSVIFKKTDVFVLPSYNEGLPMSILEAMSYGQPIVSTNVGSVDEAVFHDENGYLISPGDVNELTINIKKFVDSDLLKKLSNKSRELAVNEFNEELYFENVINLYEDLIS